MGPENQLKFKYFIGSAVINVTRFARNVAKFDILKWFISHKILFSLQEGLMSVRNGEAAVACQRIFRAPQKCFCGSNT